MASRKPKKDWTSITDDQRHRVRCSGWTVPRELHEAVRQRGEIEGRAASRVVTQALREYFARHPRPALPE